MKNLANGVGGMNNYQVIYSSSFVDSLSQQLNYWQHLGMSEATIKKQMKLINCAIASLQYKPEIYAEVSKKYNLKYPTRRILIGKAYAIFYRVYPEKNLVLIGSLFHQKQMRLKF